MSEKVKEADKLVKKATKYCSPSFFDFRLKADWEAACPLLEKAALLYKQAGELEKALNAYERCATAQEKTGSGYHAAKHYETCGELAKTVARYDAVSFFYKQAAQYYVEVGRGSTGADALARGAKSLEEKAPNSALELYRDSLELYENEGKDAQATDVYRSAIAMVIRGQQWPEAVELLMRMGAACDKSGAKSSQCKAYLGAIVVWLYAGQGKQAWTTFQDCLGVGNFVSSNEAFAADALFDAYKTGKEEAIKKVVNDKHCIRNLDNQVAKLAIRLPTADVASVSKEVLTLSGNEGNLEDEDEEVT